MACIMRDDDSTVEEDQISDGMRAGGQRERKNHVYDMHYQDIFGEIVR
jgi:hypothetical protein